MFLETFPRKYLKDQVRATILFRYRNPKDSSISIFRIFSERFEVIIHFLVSFILKFWYYLLVLRTILKCRPQSFSWLPRHYRLGRWSRTIGTLWHRWATMHLSVGVKSLVNRTALTKFATREPVTFKKLNWNIIVKNRPEWIVTI